MNTFLPYPSFVRSVRALDNRRLGKQRVEAYQILRIFWFPELKGWRNHPCVAMWRGYEDALKMYYHACLDEWERRGCTNNMQRFDYDPAAPMPWWLGKRALHKSHRSNLIRKDADFYGRLWPEVSPDLAYWWPTEQGDAGKVAQPAGAN